MIYHTPEPLVL